MTRAVLIKSALTELRRRPGRLAAVLIAVVISVGYLSGTLVFLATETGAMQDAVTTRTAGSDVVVTDHGAGPKAMQAARDKVSDLSGVSTAELSYTEFAQLGHGSSSVELQSLPKTSQFRWADLEHGHWPAKEGQIAIGSDTAHHRGLSVGDSIRLQDVLADDGGSGRHQDKLTVTGITDQEQSLFSGQSDTAFVPAGYLAGHGRHAPDVLVSSSGAHSPGKLASQIRQVTGNDVKTQTADAYAQQQLDQLTQGIKVFRMLLTTFGGIALLVGGILITNTFLILLVQRRRQIGLMRAVGATGAQVRRSVIAEAAVIGSVGSGLGVAAGIGLAATAAAVSGSLPAGLTVPPTVIIAGLVGVAITVGAALVPAVRATRISPLAALSPVSDEETVRRTSKLRVGISLVLAAIGAPIIAAGFVLDTQPLLLAVAGSMLLALGWLAATGVFLPLVLKILGWPARIFGPTGRLAAANTVRHPGRASATAMAIMLAVGLIVTLQVGSASMKASMSATLDDKYPTDITLTTHGKRLPADLQHRVADMSEIAATQKVPTGKGTIAGTRMRLQAPGPEADTVVRHGADAIRSGHVVLSSDALQKLGLKDGQRIRVAGSDGHTRLTVTRSRVAGDSAIVTRTALHRLAGGGSDRALWARTTAGADVTAVGQKLDRVVDDTDLTVGGSLTQKASSAKIVDTMLEIATALLGVAVLIALIGIGNTLALSVTERTRESALLRALGLARRQLRLMLAIEAVLLAVGGAAVGIVAGTFFGWVGSNAVIAEAEIGSSQFAMSAPQTVAVALLAVAAGVVASVLPGRRAAKTAPVEAL